MADFRIEAKDATELVVERQFAAKVETVVQAFLEPDMLKKWMGSAGMPLETAGIDPRPGGAFRYVWGMPDTEKVVLTGQFHVMDVAPNGDRAIVHSEIFEPDWTGGETLVRTDYTAQMGGTLVRTVISYGTAAARDGAAASDMGDSMRAAYDRLDGLLAAD